MHTPKASILVKPGSSILVLGAGLAGACLVRALARAGAETIRQLVVVELGGLPAACASGNPVGILHPLLSRDFNRSSQLALRGLLVTRGWLEALEASAAGWAGWPGALERVDDEETACRSAQSLAEQGVDVSVRSPDEVARLLHDPDARWWGVESPLGAWVEPASLTAACLAEARRILGDRLGWASAETEWRQQAHEPVAEYVSRLEQTWPGEIVDCTGDASLQTALQSPVAAGLQPVAGQLSWVDFDARAGTSPISAFLPTTVICGAGYAAWLPEPTDCASTGRRHGRLAFGASFEPRPGPGPYPLRATDEQDNLHRLAGLLPSLGEEIGQRHCDRLQGRRSIRMTSPDRLPMVGPVPAAEGHRPKRSREPAVVARRPQWWMSLAYGSRGLSLAPWASERLAAQILGQEPPDDEAYGWLDPGRFIARCLR